MLMGAICGVVYALGLTQEKFGPLSDYITMYFSGNTAFSGSGGELFFECFMKYGKTAAVLWIIAFIPQAIFLTLPLLFVKGMTLGFTATFFVRLFGASGIYNAILLFLLQNIILVPTYIFITVSGFSFAIGKLLPAKAVHKTGKGLFAGIKSHFSQISALSISEYTVVLIIGAACVALAGMIEVFILPHLVNFLGRTGL